MQTVALARKWRPKSFAELVGQQHVVDALTYALQQQRLHHAYLLSGTRGVGKTTLGRIFAKALNCEQGITPAPCGQCAACRAIDEGRFTDLIEIDAASRTKVEDTRELLDNVQFLPTEGRFKIYLIDEVHMLSTSSFNALLKTLEEPPEHVKFILATTDPHKLPITVLSRCLKFNLLRIMPVQIAEHLRKIVQAEGVEASDAALQLIAYHADGSVRDALSLLDQAIAQGGGQVTEETVRTMLGLATETQLTLLLDALADEDSEQLAQAFEQLAQSGVDYALLLSALIQQFHLIALLQVLGQGASDQDVRLAQTYTERFSPERVQLCYQTGLLGQQDLNLAPDARTAFEMTLLRMLVFEPMTSQTAPHVSQKVANPPKTAQNAPKPEGQKTASLKKRGDPPPQTAPAPQAQQVASPAEPALPPLDTGPLVEPPTGEAALQGEEKQSLFAQMRAQLGGAAKGKPKKPSAALAQPAPTMTEAAEIPESEPLPDIQPEVVPAPPMDEAPVAMEAPPPWHEAPPIEAEMADVPPVPEPIGPAEAMVEAADAAPAPLMQTEQAPPAWWSAAQWHAHLEEMDLDGLLRQLAHHCVVAKENSHWQLAVAPEAAHLQQQKGAALAEKLGQATFVPWADQGETISQWQAKNQAQQQAAAREAFLQDEHVQRMQQMFDAKIIESSIKAKES